MLGQQIESRNGQKRDKGDLAAGPTGTGVALRVRAVVHGVTPAGFQSQR